MAIHSDRNRATDWHRVRLTRDEYEGGEARVIEGTFRRIYIASNGPRGMAMLGTWEDGGYSVYFTPASLPHALVLLRAYSAAPADPPAPRHLTLICGDPGDAFSAVLEC